MTKKIDYLEARNACDGAIRTLDTAQSGMADSARIRKR